MFAQNQYYIPYATFNPYAQYVQCAPANSFNAYRALSLETSQRTRFTKEEDELLRQLVNSQPQPNWNEIACHMKKRTARQCRERYNNYLRPNLVNGPWTKEEEELLLKLYEQYGPKWSLISQSFNSRSPVNVKNHHSSLVSQSFVKNRKNRVELKENDEFKETTVKIDENTNFNVNEKSVSITYNESYNEKKPINDQESSNDQNFDMFSNFEQDDDIWSNTLVPSFDSNILAF